MEKAAKTLSKRESGKSKTSNVDFFLSVKEELDAIDHLKRELCETEEKIKKHGREFSFGINNSCVMIKKKKRKIVWSDHKTEEKEEEEAKTVETEAKSSSKRSTFFNTNLFDNFRDDVEDDLRNNTKGPKAPQHNLFTDIVVNKSSSVASSNPFEQNILVNSSGGHDSSVKRGLGILKMTQHHRSEHKSFENPVVTSKLLKTNVTRWKMDGLMSHEHEPVNRNIPNHMMMAWEPIILPDLDNTLKTPLQPPDSFEDNLLMRMEKNEDRMKMNERITKRVNRSSPIQKRVQILEKNVKPNVAKSLKKLKRINKSNQNKLEEVAQPIPQLKEESEEILDEKTEIVEENKEMEMLKDESSKSNVISIDMDKSNSDYDDDDDDNKEQEKSPEKEAKTKIIVKPNIKKRISKVEEPVRQSTPKIRHYDQTSVRKYIKKQKEERRLKHQQDRIIKQKMAEERKKKMDEIQLRQKSLAVNPIKNINKSREINSRKSFDKNLFDSDSTNYSDLEDESSAHLLLNYKANRSRSSKKDKPETVISTEHSQLPHQIVRNSRNRDQSQNEIPKEEGLIIIKEQIKTLSDIYQQTIDSMVNVKPATVIPSDLSEAEQLDRIRNQAEQLQKLIDERMKRLKTERNSKFQNLVINGNNSPHDDPSILECSKLSEKSEGKTTSSNLDVDVRKSSSEILRQIALNTVLSKTKLQIHSEPKKEPEEKDWRTFLPAKSPDPQNFVNSWTRKLTIDGNAVRDEEEEEEDVKLEQNENVIVDDDRFSYAIVSDRVETVATPTVTQTSIEMDIRSINSQKEEEEENIEYEVESQTTFSENEISVGNLKDGDVSSQHSAMNVSDDQLSEGPLSYSDYRTSIKPIDDDDDNNVPMEDELMTIDNDTLSGQQSLPRDQFDSENDFPARNTLHNSNVHNVDDHNGGDGDHGLSHYAQNGVYMMSPNTLRLRLSTELNYLDNIHESLGQLQHVEKLGAISTAAQRQISTLTKYNQKQESIKSRVKEHSEDNNSDRTKFELLQCQAEAIKMSAEATKQLAELNKSLLERRNEVLTVTNVDMTATVAATTSAAVTAALNQLKHKLQITKRNKTKSKSDSSSNSNSNTNSNSQSSSKSKSEKSSTSHRDSNSTVKEQNVNLSTSKAISDKDLQQNSKSNASISSSVEEDLFLLSSENKPNTISEIRSKNNVMTSELTSYAENVIMESSESAVEKDKRQMMDEDVTTEGLILSDSSSGSSKLTDRTSDKLLENFGDKSFRQFTLAMVRQNMAEEEQRFKYQQALIKFREKALIDKGKAEFQWIKLKIRQAVSKGDNERVKFLKRQREHLMDKLKQDHSELKSIKDQEKLSSSKRKSILKQQEEVVQFFISSEDFVDKLNMSRDGDEEISDTSNNSLLKPTNRISKQNFTENNSQSGNDEIDEKKGLPKNLKILYSSKRYLSSKEQSIMQRRQTIEELIEWRQKLEKEEKDVQNMEKEMFKMLNLKQRNLNRSQSSNSEDSKRSLSQRSVSKSISVQEKLESFEFENSLKSSSTIVEEFLKSSDSQLHLDDHSVVSASVTERQSLADTNGTSLSAHSSLEHLDKEQDLTNQSINSLKSKSVILREPLAPNRTQTRRRRDSSGSEESGPISQSETASDLSDIEGRIFALKEELRRRRKEAESLKKEQKRKTKDRLTSQETSLVKQIEAYDRFIVQTKDDLQKELEDESMSKIVVKPVIKTPKVAESKRLHRQSGLDGDKIQNNNNSQIELSDASKSPKSNDDCLENDPLDVSGVYVSSEENEDTLESVKFDSQSVVSNIAENVENIEPDVDFKGGEDALDGSGSVFLTEEISNPNVSSSFEEGSIIEQADNLPPKDDPVQINSNLEHLDIEISTKSDLEIGGNSKLDADHVVETLLNDILSSELELVLNIRKQEKICKENSAEECQRILKEEISNSLFNDILENSLNTALTVFKSNSTFEDSHLVIEKKNEPEPEPEIENENENSDVSKRELNFHHESYITQRVNNIMAEVNDKKSSATKTRPQDMFVLSFGDTNISPENSLSPVLDCPSKMEYSSPVKRPSSPVFGESGELNVNVESAVVMTTEMNPLYNTEEGLGEEGEEWFDDDFGLSDGQGHRPHTDENQMRRYQVYPYQNYYYIREIPNKPPPPYTPPGQALNTVSATASANIISAAITPVSALVSVNSNSASVSTYSNSASTATNYSNSAFASVGLGNSASASTNSNSAFASPVLVTAVDSTVNSVVSKLDERKISNELNRVVNYNPDHVKKLVNTATTFIYSRLKDCVEVRLDEIDGFFTVEDLQDDVNNRSRRFYKEFLLALVYEMVNGIYNIIRLPIKQPVWCKSPTISNRKSSSSNLPKTIDELLPVVHNKVVNLLSKTNHSSKTRKLKWGRKKRDFVDEILLQELRMEENEWTTYNEDEMTVKMQLSDSIFDSMIVDTVNAVKLSWRKKFTAQTSLLVTDI
ncbi:hypothetical protein CHUAL_006041 [Chamberlinius hualienensis]